MKANATFIQLFVRKKLLLNKYSLKIIQICYVNKQMLWLIGNFNENPAKYFYMRSYSVQNYNMCSLYQNCRIIMILPCKKPNVVNNFYICS